MLNINLTFWHVYWWWSEEHIRISIKTCLAGPRLLLRAYNTFSPLEIISHANLSRNHFHMGQILLIELLSGLTCLRKSCKWATRCQPQANNQIAKKKCSVLSAQARTRTQTTITITAATTTSHKAIILFNAAEPFALLV